MNNTVSIDTNVTVDSYQIIDDLNIVDEAVQTNIVDALFTSTQPDWDVSDPDSPYYIKHKPTKTSDFINDGSDGTDRYVEMGDIDQIINVDDVQVKTTSGYASVVIDRIAKIDLSNYVVKEFKTGSDSVYKVLSDNNYTDADKSLVSYLRINGDGSQALTNNGTYRDIYNILTVNGVSPVDKNVTITTENIQYNSATLKSFLDKTVTYNSTADKSITLDNNKFLYGKNTTNNTIQLLGVNSSNSIILGDSGTLLNIVSSGRITVNSSNSIAYLSDITNAIDNHNSSNEAHSDIRNEIEYVESYMVTQLSAAEMDYAVINDILDNGAVVVATTTDYTSGYVAGKLYKYNKPNRRFDLISNYQVENIYGSTSPTTATVGVAGQLYFDVVNLKIYRCQSNTAPYTWSDITPVSSSDTQLLQQVINNEIYIKDVTGGFTAGNGYLLLDSSGIIPVERIPQAVLQGLTYGGSFNGSGIITASAQAQAIDGQVIDTINKLYYKNYYFLAKATYTLDGETYIAGNFALSTGTEWVKIANSGQVISVNGYDGVVTLNYTDVNAIGIDKLVTSWSSTTSNDNVPSEKLVKDSLDTKQNNLSTAQLTAVNSGIDSTKVGQISTNATNISNLQYQYLTITLNAQNWSNNEQTINVSTITGNSMIWVAPAPTSIVDYTNAGVIATSQGSGTLTFTCNQTPTNNIDINLIINNAPNTGVIQTNGNLYIFTTNDTITQDGEDLYIGGNN